MLKLHRHRKLALVAWSALLISSISGASESSQYPDPSKYKQPWLFGGFDIGFSYLSANGTTEANKSGYQLNLRLMPSFYWEKFILDIGGGWQYSRISGSLSTGGSSVQITTRTGTADLSGLFRLSERWSLGPSFSYLFGTDPTFSPTIGPSASLTRADGTAAFMGGAQLYFDIPQDDWRMRLSARFTSDLNISERQLYVIQVGLQIGIPLFGRKEPKREEPVPEPVMEPVTAAPAPEPTPEPTPEPLPPPPMPVEEPKPDVQVKLGTKYIHFRLASHKLRPQTLAILKELGQFLAANDAAWGTLEVVGHTDNRGSAAYNNKLSKNRAAEVRRSLIKGGADGSRIKSKGKGFSEPIRQGNNETSWAYNRRVELRFFDTPDPKTIKRGLDRIQKKLRKSS